MKIKERLYQLLRWSERYTKTDMVYVYERGSWVLFAQIIATLSALAVTILLANLLSQESFGQYRFILSVVPILAIFTLPGIATAMVRSVARGNQLNFSKIIATRIRWGFIGSLASLVLAIYYISFGNQLIAYAFLIAAFFIPFYRTFLIFSFYYKGKQNFKKSAIYESISRIIQALLLILTALITKNVLLLIITFFAGMAITHLYFYFKTLKNEGDKILKKKEGLDEKDDTIPYGKYLSAVGVLGIITANMDKLFVWHFLGDEELAIYFIALVVPYNFVLLLNVLPRIAFPKFSKSAWSADQYTKIIRKLFLLFAILILPALLYAIIIPFLLPLLFSEYSASISIAIILALLIPILPVNAMIAQILRATKSIRTIVLLRILAFIVFSGTFLFTYTKLGIAGVATALVSSEVFILLAGLYLLKRASGRAIKTAT